MIPLQRLHGCLRQLTADTETKMETEGAKSERHGGQSGIRIALSELASEVMQHHFYILYLL